MRRGFRALTSRSLALQEPSAFGSVDSVPQWGDGGHGPDLEPDGEFGSDVVHSTRCCAGFIQVGDINTPPGIFYE